MIKLWMSSAHFSNGLKNRNAGDTVMVIISDLAIHHTIYRSREDLLNVADLTVAIIVILYSITSGNVVGHCGSMI